uniref:NAC domain-containing protein n=1 Tax=Kalanchoe fedtschenkoi TaxID=63787 RepID=A0A7N0UMB1_KALFE
MSKPVGYRFHPTDQELVNHYLRLKNQGSERDVSNIREVDVCKWEPWEIPGHLCSDSDDQEWYFFGRRDSKYGKSTRSNRATKDGFWKPTGRDRFIKTSSKKLIGTKKTLVFYKGRAQRAHRTRWVMHEYRASADKHNPQAFVLYLLKKKEDENPEISNSDDKSSPSVSLLINNNAPSYSPSTPTLLRSSGNFSSSDQTRVNQNWKEQEVSSHAQNVHSPCLEDDIDFQAFERFFDGQPPTWDGLDRMLPAIPLSGVYPNQGPTHMTARYINVSSNDHGVTQFSNSKSRQEAVHNIDDVVSSVFTLNTLTLDAESGTETDNDVPQSLFDEEAVYGGSAYLSDSESSNAEFYNDMILAHEVSLSTNNSGHFELQADGSIKRIASGRIHGSANNPRTGTNSEVPAQASSKKERSYVPPKKLESKIVEAVSDDDSSEGPAKSSAILEVSGNESGGAVGSLGREGRGTGFMHYAENPRVNNGTTPPSNYILNLIMGIFLTGVIMGEVLFGLVT